MAGSGSSSLTATLVAGLALVAAGVFVSFSEARPYVASGVIDSERFSALARQPIDAGLSLDSRYVVLQTCVRTMTSAYARTQSPRERNAVAANCREMADDLVRRQPSDSFALFVGALSRQFLRQSTEAVEWLGRSQVTAPNEQWLAELRVSLGENLFQSLTPEVAEQHARDLRMLVVSTRGIRSIAQRYVDDPGFRERITRIVETLPASDQARFLGVVRDAANRAGAV